jgi:uncharacterized membrane protein HdeD (DUF308 family)
MFSGKLFAFNEIVTLMSGVVAAASYLWMKRHAPDYKLAHLNSPGPILGLVEAYRQSARPEAEKSRVVTIFHTALVVFLVCGVISFVAGFIAALRGPTKMIHF